MLFPLIAEHEEWCKKDKCASKQCQSILEYRSRKEFKFTDNGGEETTIQVCDDICYEMFRLQQALKQSGMHQKKELSAQDKSKATDEERKQEAAAELENDAIVLEQLKILQEREGYNDDWAARNKSRLNYFKALNFFNTYFTEEERKEKKRKREEQME